MADRPDRRHKARKTVRERYGTKVAFRVTCTACGKDDTLPFVPRAGRDVLCRACAEEKLGVVNHDADSAGFTFDCGNCGVEAWIPRKPKREGPLLCRNCLEGIEDANPERLHGAAVVDKKVGVRRRSKKPVDGSGSA